jgi:hypothetical protein
MFPSNNTIWLLLALLACWSSAQTFPSIAEVDILFPRNDTYAPTVLMPLVFAIQNTPAAASLNLALEWRLYQLTNSSNTSVSAVGFITKSYLSASTPGPYYEYSSLYNLTTLESTWGLFWSVSSVNCTQFPTSDTSIPGYIQENNIMFTTKNGAQLTDLVAATADDVCASAESYTFNVTGVEKVSAGAGSSVTCAVVATMSPTPSPNPCEAQLNATGASSISVALPASACSLPSVLVSCPAKSAGSKEGQLGGLTWVVAAIGWLLFTPVR